MSLAHLGLTLGVACPHREAKVPEASKKDERRHSFETQEFLNLTFTNIGMGTVLDWLRSRTDASSFAYIVTPNVDHLLNLREDERLRDIYQRADLCLCDSRVLALLAKLSGIDLHVSPGSELVARLLRSIEPGRSLCVIGSGERLRTLLPGVAIHFHVPPMGLKHDPAAQAEAVAFVRSHPADYILLAVGSPQQEMLADLLKRDGQIRGTALCIGAAIQFFTGERKRAPQWVQHLSLEWAYRLLQEPRRLVGRYLVKGTAILPLYLNWRRSERKRRK